MAVFFEYAEGVEFGRAAVATSTEIYYSMALSKPASVIVAQHSLSPGHTGTSEFISVHGRMSFENTGATGATVGVSIQYKEATAAAWSTMCTGSGTITSTLAPKYVTFFGHTTVAKILPVQFRIVVTATATSCTAKMGSGDHFVPYAAGWVGS